MPHDIVDLLGEAHARLAERVRELRACARPLAARVHFDDFAVHLGAHLTVIRRVVYPALKTVGWRNINSSLLIGHAKLTHAFAELLVLKDADGVFVEALADVLEATERLLEREREALLPLLAEHLVPGERLALAADASRYLPPPPRAERPASGVVPATARDWIEEARLLLSSVPNAEPQEPST